MTILDLIAWYNDQLDDAMAASAFEDMTRGLKRFNLAFGDRLLCNVLRPQLLSEADYAFIQRECAIVLSALGKAYDALMADPKLRDILALSDIESAALDIDPRYKGATPFARLDSFFTHGESSLQFVEYNAETPAGVGYEDALSEVFLTLEPVKRLAAKFPLRAIEGTSRVLATLTALCAEAGVPGEPAVGIVDWDGVPTRPEFEIMAARFRDAGVPTVIGAPDELAYRGGVLHLSGEPITIVYKRVLASEFLQQCGLDHPLVHALRDGAAVMANPFRCKLLHKKSIFAVLSDEAYGHLYSAEEHAAIAAHVPWTRVVTERKTHYEGVEIDLLPWISTNREMLVMKPNDEYGGKGVYLGWETDPATWDAAIQDGLTTPTVVQTKVKTAIEPFPVWNGQGMSIEPRYVDLDPYIYHGREVHGILTRLSPGGLLNVTAGAGSVTPTLIVGA